MAINKASCDSVPCSWHKTMGRGEFGPLDASFSERLLRLVSLNSSSMSQIHWDILNMAHLFKYHNQELITQLLCCRGRSCVCGHGGRHSLRQGRSRCWLRFCFSGIHCVLSLWWLSVVVAQRIRGRRWERVNKSTNHEATLSTWHQFLPARLSYQCLTASELFEIMPGIGASVCYNLKTGSNRGRLQVNNPRLEDEVSRGSQIL